METIGWICEEADQDDLEPFTADILTAVVNNAVPEQPNVDVKRVAMQALFNALEFARQAFESDNERNYIMRSVLEATHVPGTGSTEKLRQIAFQCLGKICSMHYEKLSPYMQGVFNMTMSAIANETEQVALQAIEVWSTIAETETKLNEEYEAQAADNVQSEVLSKQYVMGALKFLVEALWSTLVKQNEVPEEDSWNLSAAGSTCLALVAGCVRDAILPILIPAIGNAINNAGND